MKMISLVNSGESLEKVIALTIAAYNSNPDFYNSYDEVIVFYNSNIIKSKKDLKVSGLISSLVNNGILSNNLNCSKVEDLYNYRKKLLNNLYKKHKISKRQLKKLYHDKRHFIKLMTNISWLEIFPDFEKRIINKIKKRFPNLRIVNINEIYSINEIINCIPHYQNFGKLYFYDYNGSTISKKVSKSFDANSLSKIMKGSVYYTFNVYILIMLIFKYSNENNAYIGYRPMKTSTRKSYNEAIEYINKYYDKILIEPRNTFFNEMLSNYSFRLPINERSSLAIYNIFYDFLVNENIEIL